jgi:hypothetical protein
LYGRVQQVYGGMGDVLNFFLEDFFKRDFWKVDEKVEGKY